MKIRGRTAGGKLKEWSMRKEENQEYFALKTIGDTATLHEE